MTDLTIDRTATLANAEAILDRAKAANRDLTAAEQAAVEAAIDRVGELDKQIKGRNLVNSVMSLGSSEDFNDDGPDRFISLRTSGVKSGLTARFGTRLGVPGMKALLDGDGPYITVPMDAKPYNQNDPPTSLLEVLPAVKQPSVFRFMRETTRQNNAAPVAAGGLKPTSVHGLTSFEGHLHVIAHVSEPLSKYDLRDAPSLGSFVQLEMVNGLHRAVENQIINGDGLGENLTGLAATSGIQTQAFTTSPILTARAAVTKVEVLGFQPAYYALNPLDWEAVETATLTAGQYVLNAEGSKSGVPVDSAARRLWGVPVVVSTAVTAGSGFLLSNGVAQVATDGQIETEQSTESGDQFLRNQTRLRVEGRFDLVVTRPLGVVQFDLIA